MKNLIEFQLFELVSYEFYLEDEWRNNDKIDSVDYKFTDGTDNFVVQFRLSGGKMNPGVYFRDYFKVNCNTPYSLTNRNPFRILGTVTRITIDFINKFKPDVLKIYHIKETREEGNNKHSSRALLNKRILQIEIPKNCPNYSYKLTTVLSSESVSVIKKED